MTIICKYGNLYLLMHPAVVFWEKVQKRYKMGVEK